MTNTKRHPDLEGSRPPKYMLAGILREKITKGEIEPGQKLPTLVALCSEYGVAKNTATGALAILKDEGLVESWPGFGTVAKEAA